MKKAIGFTVFDRIDYLTVALESWSKVKDIDTFDFYFFVEPSDKFEAIDELINNFRNKISSHVVTTLNPSKFGCAKNSWQVFDLLFKKYDFVVLAEDDISVSKDILQYLNECEKMYVNDDSVAIISANTKWHTTEPNILVREQAFNGLIWGTWKKYWNDYFRDTWDFDYSSGNGFQAGWDWNIALRILPKHNMFSIHPHVSRSQHIGVDGLHCNADVFEMTQSPSFNEDNVWESLVEA